MFVNEIRMNVLKNNPYRLLGVYTNSPTKERLANHNRMKAFLKVGKSVSFSLDLPQYLQPINRTDPFYERNFCCHIPIKTKTTRTFEHR